VTLPEFEPLFAESEPTANVQVGAALQFQPDVLALELKVVLSGTVSVSTTPVAPWLPTLL
jgi:hypothetical protein